MRTELSTAMASLVINGVMLGGPMVLASNEAQAQGELGKVEIACADYDTGMNYAAQVVPIQRAYGGCPLPYKNYFAGASLQADDGSTYVLSLWFSRNPRTRGYSTINSVGIYKVNGESTQSLGALLDGWQCGAVLVADNQTISQAHTTATSSGYSYPNSFACSLKIRPAGI